MSKGLSRFHWYAQLSKANLSLNIRPSITSTPNFRINTSGQARAVVSSLFHVIVILWTSFCMYEHKVIRFPLAPHRISIGYRRRSTSLRALAITPSSSVFIPASRRPAGEFWFLIFQYLMHRDLNPDIPFRKAVLLYGGRVTPGPKTRIDISLHFTAA